MQSSTGDHKNFKLDSEFDGDPMERNQSRFHMRPSGGPG